MRQEPSLILVVADQCRLLFQLNLDFLKRSLGGQNFHQKLAIM